MTSQTASAHTAAPGHREQAGTGAEHRERPQRRDRRGQEQQRAHPGGPAAPEHQQVAAVAAERRQADRPRHGPPEARHRGRREVPVERRHGDEEHRGGGGLHRQRLDERHRQPHPALQQGAGRQRQHPADDEGVGQHAGSTRPEVAADHERDAHHAEPQAQALARRRRLTEQRPGADGHHQRLERGDERGGARRDAHPDAGHDSTEVQALAQQPDEREPGPRVPVRPHPPDRHPGHEQDRRDDVPPAEEGVRGRVPGAELGADEAGAPHHDQQARGEGVGTSHAAR